jgi:cob(I)alamin adenosyltransferase
MTVNLTRIYTKLGDGGDTHLGDMSRVSKLHPRVEAYGTVDELNATIGVALLAPGLAEQFAAWLRRVQNDLLDVGADLSVPAPATDASVSTSPADEGSESPTRERLRVGPDYTRWLEHACDEVNATLEPLRSFVIPGGSPAAAHLHVCRTVCRRAERRTIAVGAEVNPEVVRYLNRLSDLLFILSRAANVASSPAESPEGEPATGASASAEPLWEPGAHRSSASDG